MRTINSLISPTPIQVIQNSRGIPSPWSLNTQTEMALQSQDHSTSRWTETRDNGMGVMEGGGGNDSSVDENGFDGNWS